MVRVVLPWISREELLETAFDQIRHYSSSDVAVSLRLLRALGDIATVAPDAALRPILADYGTRIVNGCRAHLSEADLRRLDDRLAPLQGPAALAQ